MKTISKQSSMIISLLILTLLLNACSIREQLSLPHQSEEKTEELPTTSPTSEGELSERNDQFVDATITRVIDGDTMQVNINGKQDNIRLLLVDTPETKHPTKGAQKFGAEASEFARETLAGKRVQLQFDGPKRDKYDRLLVYLWIDENMFNEMLLERGLARYAYVYDPPYLHSEAYIKAQSKAQRKNIGIWSIDGYVTNEGFNTDIVDNQETTEEKLPFEPDGPDRDCADFSSQSEAQQFYEAAGGPEHDPHRLDGSDKDGIVCEGL